MDELLNSLKKAYDEFDFKKLMDSIDGRKAANTLQEEVKEYILDSFFKPFKQFKDFLTRLKNGALKDEAAADITAVVSRTEKAVTEAAETVAGKVGSVAAEAAKKHGISVDESKPTGSAPPTPPGTQHPAAKSATPAK